MAFAIIYDIWFLECKNNMAPAMRGCVVTKSPLTNTFLDSYFGGSFSPEIKYAGYDGIIITGKADKPVYIWIDDDQIEIRDAAHILGTDALDSNETIKTELKDDTIKIAGIGQAGENRVCNGGLRERTHPLPFRH